MKSLLENGPKRCIGSPFSARSVLVRSDYGGVDDGAGFVYLKAKRLEHLLPDTSLGPIRKAVIDALPRAEALRQVSPRDTSSGAVEHRVNELPVTQLGSRARASIRQHQSKVRPLFVAESVSVHRKL